MQVFRGVRSDARAWQGNGEMYSPVHSTRVHHSTLAENTVLVVVLLVLYCWYELIVRTRLLPVTGMYY